MSNPTDIPDPLTDPFLGAVLAGKYEMLSCLGGGGAGLVYKAKHIYINKIVAIKILFPHLAIREEKVQRFQREALAISHLNHPNIIGVLDFGQAEGGQPYLAMEYVEGTNLSDMVKNQGALPVGRAIPIFMQICDALAHAHSKSLVHRDLKTSNVMILTDADGTDTVKLIDFGLAKTFTEQEGFLNLTQTGEIFGSPYFMSPEQIRGEKVDLRTDIYSMGILIYETLMGKVPFGGDDPVDVFNRQLSEDPGPLTGVEAVPYIRDYLELIILKCMAKPLADRYQSMDELKVDLQFARKTPKGLQRTGTMWKLFSTRLKGYLATSKKPLWALMAISSIVVGALIVLFYFYLLPHGAPATADTTGNWKTEPTQVAISADDARQQDMVALFLLKQSGRTFGVNSKAYADELNEQGQLLMEAHRWSDAAADFKQALEILQKREGTNSFSVATTANNLANCYYKQGKFDLAQGLYESSIRQLQSLYTPKHPALAQPMCNLADIYSRQGKFQQSYALLEPALAIWKEQNLEQSPDYLMAQSRLADFYFRQNQLSKAKTSYRDLLTQWQKLEGPQNQNALVCLQQLATIAEKEHRREDRLKILQQELLLLDKYLGQRSIKSAYVLQDLAALAWKQGKWAEALQLNARANDILAKSNLAGQ